MARAIPQYQPQDQSQPGAGEWQDLRSELVALLDQVETQVSRSSRPDTGYQGLAERMRDLRHQVAESEPETRHREALKSVQRAIDRFSDRDEPAPFVNPRDTLESAIQQIRTRHFPPPPQPQPVRVQDSPRFDELAHAVGGISDRLERLEGELRLQARGQTGNIKEIADQVGQLSHVVELLAGAVGETGQVKRLESQIAGLAKLITQGPQVDPTALNRRLDDVAATVGKLAELQKHYADRIDTNGLNQRLDDVSATVGRLADLQVQNASKLDNSGLAQRLDDVSATVGRLADLQVQYADKADTSTVNRRLDDFGATMGRLAELNVQLVDKTDTTGLTQRLDDVSATIGRLADLQVQFANRLEHPRDGLKDGLKAIEDGVRNIYDRIDSIEKSVAMPAADLERITDEMARFTAAMRAPQPQGLVELIDALNVRISDMENGSGAVGGLQADVVQLRAVVLDAMEPRFAALENQLGTLADKLEERPADVSVAQLEAQVRQLVARMDQTGEQLTGLAKLYSQPAERDAAPDFDQLADIVAERTSAAMARLEARSAPLAPVGIGDAGLDEIEKRIAKLMRRASTEQPSESMMGLQATIGEVNDRLARLESTLTQRGEPEETAFTRALAEFEASAEDESPTEAEFVLPTEPEAAPAEINAEQLGSMIVALSQEMPATPVVKAEPVSVSAPTPARPDTMPANPAEDAPLVVRPFGDPNPLNSALEAKNGPRKRHPGLDGDPEVSSAVASPAPEPTASRPAFDPSLVERPPQPRSTLDLPEAVAFASTGVPESVAGETTSTPNRNTFIEAHRRAARQASSNKVDPITGSGSLIGRAFARFQASRPAPLESDATSAGMAPAVEISAADEAMDASAPQKSLRDRLLRGKAKPTASVDQAEAAKPAKPVKEKPSRKERQLAGDKEPRAGWPMRKSQRVVPVAPEPSLVALGAETTSPDPDAPPAKPESFLLRHKQPILLAASVIALACLTINLINQRMNDQQAATAAAKPSDVGEAAPVDVPVAKQRVDALSSAEPRLIPMVDSLTTASIDASAAQGFVAGQPSAMPKAFVAAADMAGADPGTDVASLSSDVTPLESPVQVEMPPASLGPESLRTAAANGDARAQFEIAAIYTEGRAVPEDLKAAAVWYERAAAQGFAPAQYRLGNLYENGRGADKDLAQARLWYQRAAEAGNRMAMHNLAALYAGGGLGTQQFDAAAKWFEEAASRGMKDSQFNLGMLYARGLGVQQDLETSFKWFSLAARKGDGDAAKARDDIAASLDAATVQRVNAEVAAWKPAPIDFVANFAPIGTWAKDFDPGVTITKVEVVKGVQKALALLGFDIGTPDGLAGPKTADAIRSFERQTGMNESGAINPRLLAVLGSQPI